MPRERVTHHVRAQITSERNCGSQLNINGLQRLHGVDDADEAFAKTIRWLQSSDRRAQRLNTDGIRLNYDGAVDRPMVDQPQCEQPGLNRRVGRWALCFVKCREKWQVLETRHIATHGFHRAISSPLVRVRSK